MIRRTLVTPAVSEVPAGAVVTDASVAAAAPQPVVMAPLATPEPVIDDLGQLKLQTVPDSALEEPKDTLTSWGPFDINTANGEFAVTNRAAGAEGNTQPWRGAKTFLLERGDAKLYIYLVAANERLDEQAPPTPREAVAAEAQRATNVDAAKDEQLVNSLPLP